MRRKKASRGKLGRKGKHQQHRNLRKVVYIFCEGKTEKEYFSYWKSHCREITLQIDQKDSQSRPKLIFDRADKKRKSLSKAEKENSEIWVVFDRDDHPNWKKAIQSSYQSGFGLALSNPCFELWGILHLTFQSGVLEREKAQRKLHQLMPKYHHNGKPYFDMKVLKQQNKGFQPISLARERALSLQGKIFRNKDLSSQDEYFDNPSTTIWMLLERLEKLSKSSIFMKDIRQLSEKEKQLHQDCWKILQPESTRRGVTE